MMNRVFLLVIFLVLALSGCQSNRSANGQINITSSDSNIKNTQLNLDEEIKKQVEREKQTLWYVLDEKGNKKKNLPENYPDVQEVKKVVENHVDVIDNRSYESVNPDDEYQFYTKSFIQSLKNSGYNKALISMYQDNQIEIERGSITWYESTFNNDFTGCKVTIESEFKILKCAQDYLDKNKLKLNIIYQQHRIIYFQKHEDLWKISNIEKSVLSKKKVMTSRVK